jgi:hypothetical protein
MFAIIKSPLESDSICDLAPFYETCKILLKDKCDHVVESLFFSSPNMARIGIGAVSQ